MKNVVQMPALQIAANELRREVEYPLVLPVVADDRVDVAQVVPSGTAYGIAVNQSTTVDDIWSLEDTLFGLGEQISSVFAL